MATQPFTERWTQAGRIATPPSVSHDQVLQEEVRAAATVGEPMPLGLVAFATGTFTFGAWFAGWFSTADLALIVPLMLVFSGIAEFITAMWSYRKGDTFGATFFGAFGSFYTVLAFADLIFHPAGAGALAVFAGPTGLYMILFAYIAVMLAMGALRLNIPIFLTLVAWAGALAFTGASSLGGHFVVADRIGGWCAVVAGVLAFYSATAILLNIMNQRHLVPITHLRPEVSDGRRA